MAFKPDPTYRQTSAPPGPAKGFTVTPAHQDIFDAVTARAGNAQIEAVAGAGKTTTLIEAMKLIPTREKVVFLAFSKSIQLELADKVPKHVDAKTMNGLGHRAWKDHLQRKGLVRSWRDIKVSSEKLRDVLLGWEDDGKMTDRTLRTYGWTGLKLANMAKSYGIVPGDKPREGLMPDVPDSWWYLVDKHSVELPETDDGFDRCVGVARDLLRAGLDGDPLTLDFNDQLYLPFVHDLKCLRYDRVFVDEAQDLSPLQHDLVERSLRKDGQLVAVGDPRQAIYGFRGADADSMNTLHERFKTVRFPLHVSYRCPKAVVALAQTVVSHIQAHEGAPDGVVDMQPKTAEKAELQPGDLVVCRTCAPTVGLAYRLLRAGTRAEVLGRDLGRGIANLIKKLQGKKRDYTIERLLKDLAEWESKKLEKLRKRRASDSVIAGIQDQAETLRVLGQDAEDLRALDRALEMLFDDGYGAEKRDPTKVTLCTVHKAKGLEADRVFVLKPELMPHPMAKLPWEQHQELNLMYVAYTRAKKELGFLSG